MTRVFSRLAIAGFACAAAFTFASPTLAEMMHFKANATGSNEVPPNDSKGTASASATYDTGSKMLTWQGTYSGLSGPPFAAHFHKGAPGKNGGIVVPLFGNKDNQSPFKGSKKLTDAEAADLIAGQWYINIHTAAHRAGEVRGQLTK